MLIKLKWLGFFMRKLLMLWMLPILVWKKNDPISLLYLLKNMYRNHCLNTLSLRRYCLFVPIICPFHINSLSFLYFLYLYMVHFLFFKEQGKIQGLDRRSKTRKERVEKEEMKRFIILNFFLRGKHFKIVYDNPTMHSLWNITVVLYYVCVHDPNRK